MAQIIHLKPVPTEAALAAERAEYLRKVQQMLTETADIPLHLLGRPEHPPFLFMAS